MSSPIRPKNFKEKVFLRKLRTQINGAAKIEHGLTQILGVGRRFAQAVVSVAGIDPNLRIGAISEKDLNKIEEIILNPLENGVQDWMANRKKDLRDGTDKHVIGNQLEITGRRDIERMKKIKSFKGQKHRKGLKVRGQRTKQERIGGVKRSKVDKDIAKLLALMKERNMDSLTIDRQYLPEILSIKLLEYVPSCSIKPEIEEYIKKNGLMVNYDGVFITFVRKK